MLDFFLLLKVASAFAFVLSLIGIFYVLAKRHQYGSWALAKKERRLRLVESLTLDNRHRLVVVRHDDLEYCLLLGSSQCLTLNRSDVTSSLSNNDFVIS